MMVYIRAGLKELIILFSSLVFSSCSASLSDTQLTLTVMYQENQLARQMSTAEPLQPSIISVTPSQIWPATRTASPTPTVEVPVETTTPVPTVSLVAEASVGPIATRKPAKYWAEWPLIPPEVSAQAREIYQRGIASGSDVHAFSVIGDCQSVPAVFMGVYDSDRYFLGEDYLYLEETIHQFQGSFGRQGVTVKDGLSVASVLASAWADPVQCLSGETPLDCELRIHKPSIVFINLGTNWQGGDEVKHAEYLRKIVDLVVDYGAVPILSSKGDNLEGDHRINRATAGVAYDYGLPFWNFWRSIRDLPGKGIDDNRPGGYLTTEAWGRRAFTGLQALDAVWRYLTE